MWRVYQVHESTLGDCLDAGVPMPLDGLLTRRQTQEKPGVEKGAGGVRAPGVPGRKVGVYEYAVYVREREREGARPRVPGKGSASL